MFLCGDEHSLELTIYVSKIPTVLCLQVMDRVPRDRETTAHSTSSYSGHTPLALEFSSVRPGPVSQDKLQLDPVRMPLSDEISIESGGNKPRGTCKLSLQSVVSAITSPDPRRILSRWWIYEVLACLSSLTSFFAIIGVLKLYEGRPQPDWPWDFTINSVVSLFTTLMKAALLAAIAVGHIFNLITG